jgi:hypothetical protein
LLLGSSLPDVATDIYGVAKSGTKPYRGAYEGGPIIVLPVVLTNYTVSKNNKDVLVKWSTSSETNNHGFEVERSLDGIHFSSIGFVTTGQRNGSINNYEFTDPSPFNSNIPGQLYYRLKQVNTDGKFKYYDVRLVKSFVNATVFSVQLTANPVKGNTRTNITSIAGGKAGLSITDINGRKLFSLQKQLEAGEQLVEIPGSASLSKGIYFLKVEMNGENRTVKFIKN